MAEGAKESKWGELRRALPMAVAAVALGISAELIVAVRPVEPLDPPMPVLETAALSRVGREHRDAAVKLLATPQPLEVRALGSAFLAWNETAAAALRGDAFGLDPKRDALMHEIREALATARTALGGELEKHLRDLRMLHAERFLCTLRRAHRLPLDPACDALLASQKPTEDRAELDRLGGALLELLGRNGWTDATGAPHVPEPVLRARYELHWTSTVFGLEDCDQSTAQDCYGLTTLSIEPIELRGLLAFLVEHPVLRPDEVDHEGSVARALDRRRLVYLDRLAELDRFVDPKGTKHPYLGAFELDLARGAMLYRLGDYAASAEVLRTAAAARPQDTRARNWFLAALQKLQPE
jgi:hypothetical protein